MYYSMRITETTLPQFLLYCISLNIQAVVGGYEHEETDNQHYHVLIDIPGKKDTLIKNMKSKGLIKTGNQSYKCKIVLAGTEHQVAKYACKHVYYGSTDKTYTKEWIEKNPYDWSKHSEKTDKSKLFAANLINDWKRYKQETIIPPKNMERMCIEWCVKYFTEKVKIYDRYIIRRFVNLCISTSDLKRAQMRMVRLLTEEF